MKLLKIKGLEDKRIWIHKTKYPLKDLPFKNKPFLCMTIGLEKLSEKSLTEIARNLVNNGCILTASAGDKCIEMENEVDLAYIEEIENKKYQGNPPESAFVSTTSHKDESMEDAIFFFFFSAHASDENEQLYKDYLILFLGENLQKEKQWMGKIKDYPKFLHKLNK